MKEVEKRQVEGDLWKVKSRPAILEGNFTYTRKDWEGATRECI
jgi:hypothetical protein